MSLTCVSAYYQVKNKHDNKYNEWFKNTLLINPFHLFSISDRVDLHLQANKNYYKNLSFQEKKEKKIYIKKGKKKIGYYSQTFKVTL